MNYSSKKFSKEYPGAKSNFQPNDLAEYSEDPWDIRISIGNAPLDEAFYLTMNDPTAVNKTVRQLLEQFALNPQKRADLDVNDYPELPFLQEELRLYFHNASAGKFKLDIYVNHNPKPGPIRLDDRASRLISTCTFDDGSDDYRVLDLIFVPEVEEFSATDQESIRRKYGKVFILHLLNYYQQKGEEEFAKLIETDPFCFCLGASTGTSYHKLKETVQELQMSGFIELPMNRGRKGIKERYRDLKITDKGVKAFKEYQDLKEDTLERYKFYDSVDVGEPALGVPEGFDARVQMMEHDGEDYELRVVLCVIAENEDDFLELENWYKCYQQSEYFNSAREVLAYKTNFTSEILEQLRNLARQYQ